MTDISTDAALPLFTTSLDAPYDQMFCKATLEWAVETVKLVGGNQKEGNGIQLALEETLCFIITSYPDAEPWELIKIEIKLFPTGTIELSVSNAGPPVHLNRVPTYTPEASIDSNIDGLWYFLAQQAVDTLEFKNLGIHGWLVLITQKLDSPTYKTTSNNDPNSLKAKGAKLTPRFATAKDAGQLMDLTFDTYRYSYPGEDFYRKSKLTDALTSGKMESIVVEAENTIVANTSVIVDQATPKCGYLSTLMVHRAFRASRAIMVLIKEINRYFETNSRQMEVYYGTMVTEHTASQKAAVKAGLKPLALLLGVGASVDYRGMSIHGGSRESFVLCSRLAKPPENHKLFLPKHHQKVMHPLLEQLGASLEFDWDDEHIISAETTAFTISEDNIESSATVVFEKMGKDWAAQTRKCLFQMSNRQIRSTVIYIPAWQQPPADLDREMGKINSIFTGIKPVSATKYYLVYCNLTFTVDFEKIQMASTAANDLKQHVLQIYHETFSE